MSRRLSSSDPSAVMSRIYRRSTAFRRDAAGAGSGGCVGEAKLCLCRLAGRVGRQHPYRTDGWFVDRGVGSSAEPGQSGEDNVIRPPDRHRRAAVASPSPCVVQSDAHGEGERPQPHEERDHCDCEGGEASDDRQHRHEDDERDGTSDGVTDHPVPAVQLSLIALHRTLGGVAPDVSGDRCFGSSRRTDSYVFERCSGRAPSSAAAYVSIAIPGVVRVLMRVESAHDLSAAIYQAPQEPGPDPLGAVELRPGRSTGRQPTHTVCHRLHSAQLRLLVGEAGTLRHGALVVAKVLTVGMAAPHTSLPSGAVVGLIFIGRASCGWYWTSCAPSEARYRPWADAPPNVNRTDRHG